MSTKVSLIRRVGMAKVMGFVIGIVGLVTFPTFWPAADMWTRVGFLLWYTTFGALIGVLGVLNVNPVLKFSMPFWFRGILFGGWLNLVLVFLMYDKFQHMMQSATPVVAAFRSPFWFAVEGMVLGLLIDWVSTRFGGEGKDLL